MRLSGRETDPGVLARREFSGENRGTGAVALAAPLAIPCHISASVPPDGTVFRLDVSKQGLVILSPGLGRCCYAGTGRKQVKRAA